MTRKKPSFVYIICHDRNGKLTGPVKIGLADEPQKRLKGLSTGNPNKIHLFHSVFMPCRETAKLIETVFLNVCERRQKRKAGEWVSLSPEKARGILYRIIKTYLEGMGADEEKVMNVLAHITELGTYQEEEKHG